jgi:hypothetical protein
MRIRRPVGLTLAVVSAGIIAFAAQGPADRPGQDGAGRCPTASHAPTPKYAGRRSRIVTRCTKSRTRKRVPATAQTASLAALVTSGITVPSGFAAPEMASTASTAPGSVLFDGSTESVWHDQSASPTRIQQVPDPLGADDTVLRLTAKNGDVYPRTPTDNPRAQLITPSDIITRGVPFWETYEVYLPPSFPTRLTDGSWIALGSPFYGSPFAGSPSIEMEITDGRFMWDTDRYAKPTTRPIWSMPVETDRWITFTWHLYPTSNGFTELYVNGVPVSVSHRAGTYDGFAQPVIDPTNDVGPWFSQLSVYMQHNVFQDVTVYFRFFKIATTEASSETVKASG